MGNLKLKCTPNNLQKEKWNQQMHQKLARMIMFSHLYIAMLNVDDETGNENETDFPCTKSNQVEPKTQTICK